MCGNWNCIFEIDKCVIELISEIDMETKLGQGEENDPDKRCDRKILT